MYARWNPFCDPKVKENIKKYGYAGGNHPVPPRGPTLSPEAHEELSARLKPLGDRLRREGQEWQERFLRDHKR